MKEQRAEAVLCRGADGGITVFLSLILTCICALLGGLYESARLAGGGWYLQMALDSSLDSLMSTYHREAWEQYRLFLLEYETEENLRTEVEAACKPYLEAAPYYGLETASLSVSALTKITEDEGNALEKQILDYMKFGIWGMEEEKGLVSELTEGLQEAESLQKLTERYQEHGTEVLGLEKALDRIGEGLKKQEDYRKKAEAALEDCNGDAFFREAKHLKKELKKMPDLVAAYEKEADRLCAKLTESEKESKPYKEDLKAGSWSVILEEMEQYRSYIEEEGKRRQEVRSVQKLAENNLSVVEEAIAEAEEVQEYIDSWEPDDEEDELDEEALWRQVLKILRRFQKEAHFETSGIQDKKTLGVLESIQEWMGKDLLDLCVPENREISGGLLNQADLPSRQAEGAGSAFSEKKEKPDQILRAFFERALTAEYTAHHFDCFLEDTASAVSKAFAGHSVEKPKTFFYEQEYVLFGFPSDRENVKAAVHRLLAVREAANLLTLFGNLSLRQEAERLAFALTGAAFGPLTGVLTFFILTVWAFAEAIADVRLLLCGASLPFLKSADQWQISLFELSESGMKLFWNTKSSEAEVSKEKEKSELDYQSYLKLFLFVQKRVENRYRMMDMIQTNLRRRQPEFRMAQCACRIEAEMLCEGLFVPVRRTTVQEY